MGYLVHSKHSNNSNNSMVIPHIFPNTLVSCTLIALSLQNTHTHTILSIFSTSSIYATQSDFPPTGTGGFSSRYCREMQSWISSSALEGPKVQETIAGNISPPPKGWKSWKIIINSKVLVRVGRYVSLDGRQSYSKIFYLVIHPSAFKHFLGNVKILFCMMMG